MNLNGKMLVVCFLILTGCSWRANIDLDKYKEPPDRSSEYLDIINKDSMMLNMSLRENDDGGDQFSHISSVDSFNMVACQHSCYGYDIFEECIQVFKGRYAACTEDHSGKALYQNEEGGEYQQSKINKLGKILVDRELKNIDDSFKSYEEEVRKIIRNSESVGELNLESSVLDVLLRQINAYPNHPKSYEIVKKITASYLMNNKISDAEVVLMCVDATNGSNLREKIYAWLRSDNSFNSYHLVSLMTDSMDDLKKLNHLAVNNNERAKVEALLIDKITRNNNLKFSSVFSVTAGSLKSGGISNGAGFGLFLKNQEFSNATFSIPITIKNNKEVYNLKYGAYDVYLKLTLNIPVSYTRQSQLLGNADENRIDKYEQEVTVSYDPMTGNNATIVNFKDVRIAYKDRGSANGTTEIKMTGKPSVDVNITKAVMK